MGLLSAITGAASGFLAGGPVGAIAGGAAGAFRPGGSSKGPPVSRSGSGSSPFSGLSSAVLGGLYGGLEKGISGKLGFELAGRDPRAAGFSGPSYAQLQRESHQFSSQSQGLSQGQALSFQSCERMLDRLHQSSLQDKRLANDRQLLQMSLDAQNDAGQPGIVDRWLRGDPVIQEPIRTIRSPSTRELDKLHEQYNMRLE